MLSYLIMVTGRRFGTQKLYVSEIENIYTEFLLLGCMPIGVLFYYLHKILYYDENIGHKLSYKHIFTMYLIGLATVVMASIFLVALLSMARKIKDKRFFIGSIAYIIVKKINSYIKDLFYKNKFKDYYLTETLYKRQRIFIIISTILVFLTFLLILVPPLMIIPPILEIILIYWYVKYNNQIFDEINKGFNESLEEQMKSERMKINLITNVSHDLKTPLTSIISYIDLLSKEELSESAKDYVNILIDKSDRLKNIVLDLFDLAKSTSGDISLELQTIDLKKLIEQTLGDMEDDIKKTGLQIKTIYPEEPMNITSDGKRLYRVFQNVIDNALKYSLQGSRIFIELEGNGGNAIVYIKNIAGYEMNFTANEILQRFNRGDKSRTAEGSGLGLSIAESFTKVSGGDFKIEIDGDMFKVIIGFKTVQLMEV
ncbi:MAG: HAMP domain-containing sensor histidine kinase [Tissierella sp.]|nr:HAMP domain-containing sensor histidine kinase [Tissierella sp.]